jgi:hypothetical protein
MAAFALSRFAIFCTEFFCARVFSELIYIAYGAQIHVPAPATITASRSAERSVFFPMPGERAVPAATCFCMNCQLINKHNQSNLKTYSAKKF